MNRRVPRLMFRYGGSLGIVFILVSAVFGDGRDVVRRWIESPYDINGDGVANALDFLVLIEYYQQTPTPTPSLPTATPTRSPTATPNPTELNLPVVGSIQEIPISDVTTTIPLAFPSGDEAYLILVRNENVDAGNSEYSVEWPGNSWFGKQAKERDECETIEEIEFHEIERVATPPDIVTYPDRYEPGAEALPQAIVVGDKKSFALYGGATVIATLRFVGTHAAIYVDDTNWMQEPTNVDQTFVNEQGAIFDSVTYPTLTSVFAVPGDVNKDGHIAILFTTAVTTSSPEGGIGFFFGGDLFTRKELAPQFPTNTMEILYIAPPNTPDRNVVPEAIPSTVGHELQHLINFYYHSLVHGRRDGTHDEERWLDEGLSHLAEDYLGVELYPNRYQANQYLKATAAVGMIVDAYVPDNTQRGGAYLFCRYLADRFGDGVLKKLADTGKQGIANVEAATGKKMKELGRDWSRAVFFSDTGIIDNTLYNYKFFASKNYLPGRWWGKPAFSDHDLSKIFYFGALNYGFLPGLGYSYTIIRKSEGGSDFLWVFHWSGPKPAVDLIRLPNDFLYTGYIDTEAWNGLILDQAYPELWTAGEERVFAGRSADGQPFTKFEYFVCPSPCSSISTNQIKLAQIDGNRFEFRVKFEASQIGQWTIGVFPNGSRLRNRVEFYVVAP